MTGVDIPDEAYEAARQASKADATRGAGVFHVLPTIVQAAAPIIVAAYIRKLAAEMLEALAGDDCPLNAHERGLFEAYAAGYADRADDLDPDGETR